MAQKMTESGQNKPHLIKFHDLEIKINALDKTLPLPVCIL